MGILRNTLLVACLIFSGQAFAEEIKIGALFAGQIDEVKVKQGDSVKAGQLLLTIDKQRYQAKLTSLESEVNYREIAMLDAKIEYEQLLDLFERAVIAKRVYDRGVVDFELAKQALSKAKADLAYHQAWLRYVEVKAPVAGKVKSLAVGKGSTVYQENDPLLVLEVN